MPSLLLALWIAFGSGDVVARIGWMRPAQYFTIPNNTLWVQLGDSITDAHLYTNYLEAYWHLRYPELTLHFRDEGRGGGTIQETFTDPAGASRFDRRVISWSPTIVGVMFGFNNSGSAAVFGANLDILLDNYIFGKTAATPVLLGPHPTYEADGTPVVGQRSDAMAAIGVTRGLHHAETWHILLPIWQANLADPTPVDLAWVDTTHPGPAGHLAIAYQLLTGLGVDPVVSEVVISASGPTLVDQLHANVTGVSANAFSGVDFTRLDGRLPMAFDDAARVVFDLMPQILDLNLYMLTVTGLAAGSYEVYIDTVLSATVTHTTLAAGWNMTSMTAGPIYAQLLEVLGCIRDKEGIDRVTRANKSPNAGVVKYQSNCDNGYNNLGLRDAALVAYLDSINARSDVAALDVSIRSAAQPVARAFSLRKV